MKLDLVSTGYIFFKDKVLLIFHSKLDKWLPVGGHIEKNESPTQSLTREVKEETNLDIEILFDPKLPLISKNLLPTPIFVDIHSVGDHDHCSFYYLCKVLNPEALQINKELKDAKWFSKQEIIELDLLEDVKMSETICF